MNSPSALRSRNEDTSTTHTSKQSGFEARGARASVPLVLPPASIGHEGALNRHVRQSGGDQFIPYLPCPHASHTPAPPSLRSRQPTTCWGKKPRQRIRTDYPQGLKPRDDCCAKRKRFIPTAFSLFFSIPRTARVPWMMMIKKRGDETYTNPGRSTAHLRGADGNQGGRAATNRTQTVACARHLLRSGRGRGSLPA